MPWTRKLPSGKWQGCYRDSSGRARTAGAFRRKADAEDAAEEQEAGMRRGTWTDPALARVSFGAWAEHYMATALNQRPTTRARDESYLRAQILPQFESAPLGRIEPVDVQGWVAELAARRAPATVAKAYQIFARIMAAAELAGYVARTPCRGVTLPRVARAAMRFLAAGELERLAALAPERHRALILTAGYTGLRWGEVTGLKRDRLNLLRGTLEVRETLVEVKGAVSFGEPKTTASRRTLSLPAFLVAELDAHLREHSTHDELVFAGRNGGPLRRSNFRRRVWLPTVERAGLSPLRFHDLRHTAVALLIGQGAHPKLIQSRLGHSSIQVTLDRYGHLLPHLDAQVADGLEEAHRAAKSRDSAAHLLHAAT